jgi:hypothetical protein
MSEDEIFGIRDLLVENGVDYYETPAGNWNISAAAIWLRDESQLQQTKDLVKAFQLDYEQRARASFAKRRRLGQVESISVRIRRQPLRVLLYVIAGLLVLYLSTAPFLHLAR